MLSLRSIEKILPPRRRPNFRVLKGIDLVIEQGENGRHYGVLW